MPSAVPVSDGVLGFPSGTRFLLPRLRYGCSGCPSHHTSGFTGDRSSSRLDSLSFGGAGCESSRLPLRFAPPVSPTISIRVAPNAHPPAPADFRSESPRISCHPVARFESPDCSGYSPWAPSINQSPSRLGSCVSRCRRFRPPRVAPKLSSSADPYLLPQVAPASAYGLVDDYSLA